MAYPTNLGNGLPQTLSQLLAQVPSSQFPPNTSAAQGIYDASDKAVMNGQPLPADTLDVLKQISANTNDKDSAGKDLKDSLMKAMTPPRVVTETPDDQAPRINGEQAYRAGAQAGEAVGGPAQGFQRPPQYGGNFRVNGTMGPASFVDEKGNPTASPLSGTENPHSATAEFTKSMQDAYHNGNPLQLIGGLFNAMMPEKGKVDAQGNPIIGSNGQQETLTQSENPNSLLSLVKSAIPGFLAPNLLDKTSRALGLGAMHPTDEAGNGPIDLFANSNQTLDPSLKARANADYNKMMADRAAASMGGFPATRFANDQAVFQKDIDAIEKNLGTQQQIGIGTPAESSEFKHAGQSGAAMAEAASHFKQAIKTGNPQMIGSTLDEMIKRGDASNAIAQIPGSAGMLQAAKAGLLDKWLNLSADNVAVAKSVVGALKASLRNAEIESAKAQRIGDQILAPKKNDDGTYDPSTEEFRIAKKFAPKFGEPNNGLPDEKEFDALVDRLDDPNWANNFNEQGVKQAKAAGVAAGRSGIASTVGNAAGKIEQAAIEAAPTNPPKAPSKKPSTGPAKHWNPATGKFE